MILKAGNTFICLFLFTTLVVAQKVNRDSLHRVVRTGHDTLKVQALNRLSRLEVSNQPDSAFVFADSALRLAESIHYEAGKGSALLALASARNTSGKYDEAITYLMRSLTILEKIGNKKTLTNSYNMLGNTYAGLEDEKSAFSNYKKAYELAAQAPADSNMMAVTSIGVGNSLMHLNQFKESIEWYQIAQRYFQQVDNPDYVAVASTMIGEALKRSGDLFRSEKYFRSAVPVFRNNNNGYGLSACLSALGLIETDRHNYAQAESYFREALDINIQRNAFDDIQANALDLSRTLEKENRPVEALQYYKVYMQYKDSVVNQARDRAVAEAESKYESGKKEQQLLLSNLELKQSQLEVSKRNGFIYIFAGATLIVLVLLFFVYRQFSQKQKANSALLLKNEEVERQKRVIEEKNTNITDSINYSRRIQQAILPSADRLGQLFPNSFVFFRPKDIVSGDFYMLDKRGENAYLSVVDCTGHGVPGAMLSVFVNSELKNVIAGDAYHRNPAGILKELCGRFRMNLQSGESAISDGADMGICIFHPDKRILYFAGARHSLLRIRNGLPEEFPGNRYGISGTNPLAMTEFVDYVIDVEPHDRYYLYTDGFADQFGGPTGKKFMKRQLRQLLLDTASGTMEEQGREIEQRFEVWRGGFEQLDDVTLIGFGT